MVKHFKQKIQEGFTLVEILIVVVIIGILATVAIPTYFSYVEKAYASDAHTQIKTLYEECKIWKTTHADFPTDLDMMEEEGAANVSTSTKEKWDLTWKLEVNTDGEILGRHRGYPAFTIGQRKGLKIGGLKEPHYVTAIDPEKNEITVGLKNSLYRSDFFVNKVNWYLPRQEVFETQVQIRYLHKGSTAKVKPLPGKRARVEFFEPQLSITPGQSAVFYVDDCIVGGGWIE